MAEGGAVVLALDTVHGAGTRGERCVVSRPAPPARWHCACQHRWARSALLGLRHRPRDSATARHRDSAARCAAAAGPSQLPRKQRSSCDDAVEATLAVAQTRPLLAYLQSPRADGGMALSGAEATAALLELLRFLALKAAFQDFDSDAAAFSCSAFLDEVWHAALLHPSLYVRMCAALSGSGKMIDHSPLAGGRAPALRAAHAQRLVHTKRAYEREYGVAPPAMWADDYQPGRAPAKRSRCADDDADASGSKRVVHPPDGASFQIFVRNLESRIITLQVESSTTVEDLKCKIEDVEGIPANKLRLLFAHWQLDDSHTMADYNISRNSTLAMMLRLVGC